METFFKYALLGFIAIFLMPLTSCQEGSEAGDLLGQWKLGGADMHYINFSGTLTRLQANGKGEVYGKFQRAGDSLFIQCVSIEGHASDTTLVEESFGMKPFTNIRLRIESLDDEHLVLTKDSQRWSFTKW